MTWTNDRPRRVHVRAPCDMRIAGQTVTGISHNLSTSVPLTNGDNAGVNMGVASGMVMGPSRHLTGAFTCLIGGAPASRMTSVSLQNSTNCPGARMMPSQVTVLILAP